jgi:glycerophosphoryl diester phosphodiesterase
MMAVKTCVNAADFKADILEMDVQMTKDGELILLHDPILDTTSNAVEAFGHVGVTPLLYNYKDLHDKLNLGAKWNESWASLRGADIPDDLRVAKLEDVLAYTEANADPQKPFYYTIEAKLPFGLGYQAADKIAAIAKGMGILDRVLFGSFFPDVAQYVSRKYPELTRTADTAEVLQFVDAYTSGADLNKLDPRYKVLALPRGIGLDGLLGLADSGLIAYAHSYGIAVHYWTVNSADDAAYLVLLGADGIITDNPEAVYAKLH